MRRSGVNHGVSPIAHWGRSRLFELWWTISTISQRGRSHGWLDRQTHNTHSKRLNFYFTHTHKESNS